MTIFVAGTAYKVSKDNEANKSRTARVSNTCQSRRRKAKQQRHRNKQKDKG